MFAGKVVLLYTCSCSFKPFDRHKLFFLHFSKLLFLKKCLTCCRVRSFLVLTVTQMTQNLLQFQAPSLAIKEPTSVDVRVVWVVETLICIVTFTTGSVQPKTRRVSWVSTSTLTSMMKRGCGRTVHQRPCIKAWLYFHSSKPLWCSRIYQNCNTNFIGNPQMWLALSLFSICW